MPQPPSLSPEQRRAALAKAARVRHERAELIQRLRLGQITVADLLKQADTDETVGRMKVLSVLQAMPGLGKVRARRLMDGLEIAESRRMSGLREGQRTRLATVGMSLPPGIYPCPECKNDLGRSDHKPGCPLKKTKGQASGHA